MRSIHQEAAGNRLGLAHDTASTRPPRRVGMALALSGVMAVGMLGGAGLFGPTAPAQAAETCVVESTKFTMNPAQYTDTSYPEPIQLDGTLRESRAYVTENVVTAEIKLTAAAKPGDVITVGRTVTASAGLSDPTFTTVWPAEVKAPDGTVLATRTSNQNEGVYVLTAAVADLTAITLKIEADSNSYAYTIDESVITKPSELVGSTVTAGFSTCDGSKGAHEVEVGEVVVQVNGWALSKYTPDQTEGFADSSAVTSAGHSHSTVTLTMGDGKEALDWNGTVLEGRTALFNGDDAWAEEVDRTFTRVTSDAPLKPGEYRLVISPDKKTATLEVYEFKQGEVTTFRMGATQVADFPKENFVGVTREHADMDGKVWYSEEGATFADPDRPGKFIYLDPEGTGNGTVVVVPVVTKIVPVGVTGPVDKGGVVDWLVTNSNADATRIAKAVTTKVTIPAGLDFVSADGGGVWDAKTRTVTWPVEDVAAKGTNKHIVKTKVAATAKGELAMPVNLTGAPCTVQGSVCQSTAKIVTRTPGLKTLKESTVADTNKDGLVGTAGDVITYKITATNTGNTPEASVKLTDTLLGIKDQECLPKGTVLNPGKSIVCEGKLTYTITEKDAKAGKVVNVATLSVPGLPPVPGEKTDQSHAPDFEFAKRVKEIVDANKNRVVGDPGDVIKYGFSVKNTGNRDIATIKISDPLLGVKDHECLAADTTKGAAEDALLPLKIGQKAECVGEFAYTVTEKDAQAKNVVNVAQASTPGSPEKESKVTTPVKPAPPAPQSPMAQALAVTGGAATGWAAGGLALLLAAAGGVALMASRKRRAGADTPAAE